MSENIDALEALRKKLVNQRTDVMRLLSEARGLPSVLWAQFRDIQHSIAVLDRTILNERSNESDALKIVD